MQKCKQVLNKLKDIYDIFNNYKKQCDDLLNLLKNQHFTQFFQLMNKLQSQIDNNYNFLVDNCFYNDFVIKFNNIFNNYHFNKDVYILYDLQSLKTDIDKFNIDLLKAIQNLEISLQLIEKLKINC